MGALLKLAAMQGLNAPELVFYRSVFSLPVVLLFVLRRESFAALRPNNPLAHVWRSGLGLLSMGLTFQALILLPLADATAINFTAPIFATILSFLILKEDVGFHRWAAVVAGFIGVLIVARPGGSTLPVLGVAIALVAALGQAGTTTTLRHLQRSENLSAIVFWFAVAGIVVGGLVMPVFGHDARSAGHGLRCGGRARGRPGPAAHDRVAASTGLGRHSIRLSADRRGHHLRLASFLGCAEPAHDAGGALIAASGLYTAWREHRRRVRQAATAVPAV